MVRRSTKGPLDMDDPLAGSTTGHPLATSNETSIASASPSPLQDKNLPPPVPAVQQKPKPSINTRFLQNPKLYQQILTDDVAPAFLTSKHQPPAGTSLSDLIRGGHFRRAAGVAAQSILKCNPDDADLVFQLLYTRFACLTLIARSDTAAEEAAQLLDILARNAAESGDLVAAIPWELRLLLVRLQSMATSDGGRRGIMALYALAAEARAHVKEARMNEDGDETKVWTQRLRDLGLRVADALTEMGELETASRHCDSLTDVDSDEVFFRKVLLRIRVGDVIGAQRSIVKLQDADRRAALTALIAVASGTEVSRTWQTLLDSDTDNAEVANNLSISLLYCGRILEARRVMEDAAERFPTFPGMLFNLSTVYELCSERAMESKVAFSEKVADREPDPGAGGWERSVFDFKL
ncbi:hypothetical protein LTR62_001298 [Meristemomyces frigidus]|uniref:Uncharacterized protein n=1 Tax=Meristemomyces frigidus TaxID=1508187 RepID=A0AAN7T9E9_9PEZI|nr:hypothetical protein LTR62_001298 [Meristemomyces frigidus]